MLCAFVYTGNRDERGRFIHKCERCENLRSSNYECPERLREACRAVPGAAQRVANFAAASREHVKSGLALVSDEVRDQRLATCQACPLYDGTICTHPKCGCPIKLKRSWFDKLSWKSSTCPLNKWPE